MVLKYTFLGFLSVNLFRMIVTSYYEYNDTDISDFHHFTMSRDLLFVGGNKGIVSLNKTDLAKVKTQLRFGSNWLLLYKRLNNTVVQCSQPNASSYCWELDTSLSNETIQHSLPMEIGETNSQVYTQTRVQEANAEVIVIGASSLFIQSKNYSIVTLDLTNLSIFDTRPYERGPMNLETGLKENIIFKSAIPTADFTFLFFNIFDKSNFTKAKVGKLCQKSRGKAKNDGNYHSYEDIILMCTVNTTNYQLIEHAVIVNNDTFVIFKKDQTYAVCIISVPSIIQTMITEREARLQCGNIVHGTYFQPNLTVNPGAQCFNKTTCLPTNGTFCSTVKGYFCGSGHYSTLQYDSQINITDCLFSGNHNFTAVAVQPTIHPDNLVMYFGTAEGYILTVFAKKMENGIFEKKKEKQINVTTSKIKDILIDKEYGIFVLTSNQVIKIFACSLLESCSFCLISANPKCGWNIINERCEEYEENSGHIPPSEKCFDFEIGNRKILIQPGVFIIMNFTRPSSIDGDLTCGFWRKSNYSWTTENNESSCVYKNEPDLFPGNYTLILKINDTIVAIRELEFILCDNLKSCEECFNYNCGWNLTEYSCQDFDIKFKNLTYCPSMDSSNGIKQMYYKNQTIEVSLIWPGHVMIAPRRGPINGGTQVILQGQNFIKSMSLQFGSAKCCITNVDVSINQLECTTLDVSTPINITNMSITVRETKYDLNNSWFEFTEPELTVYYPKHSIKSGGRKITIIGSNIGFHGRSRYQIQFCNHTKPCVECRYFDYINDSAVSCLTGNVSTPMVLSRLEVIIDRNTTLNLNETFTFVTDPDGFALSNETASVLQSGGAKIEINGNGFSKVGKVTIERVKKPCDIASDILVECETPEYQGNRSLTKKVSETVNVYFDDLAVPVTIDYVCDPSFEQFKDVVEYEKGASIEIKGRNILTGAQWDVYTIYIGRTGLCYTEKDYVTDSKIKCWPPQHVPLTNYTDKNLVDIHIKIGRLQVHIGLLKYIEETNDLEKVISVLAVALVITTGSVFGAALSIRKKQKKAKKRFILELQTVEERVRTNSREEFAETQTAIGDIQSDLVTSNVPYRDYQTYILLQLFPNQGPNTNALLYTQAARKNDGKYQDAIEKLELLLQNKLFLKSLVHTLDRPTTLIVQEKAQFAALLSLSLLGNMRLFFNLVHCLLDDMIRSVTRRHQRVLFRRLDSLTSRMMTNWLLIVHYQQLQTINIDLNGDSEHCYQVKVLECDTISQVKKKCCVQIYKNNPTSEIPLSEELDLELKEGHAARRLLRDIDKTSEQTDGNVRLNTLTHYNVGTGCKMALVYSIQKDNIIVNPVGQSHNVSLENVNLLIPDSDGKNDNLKKWHLLQYHGEEELNSECDIGDIYLNRLFCTKLLLSKYIDSTFEVLLNPECVSLPIAYFIQTLENMGKTHSVDLEVIQIWKNESYATRLWAPLISKPQTAFDISVPEYIEPVMDILSQVFVECFTQTSSRVNKESPIQRLLFHKDIERYRKSIGSFYSQMEPVADHDFWRTLDQLSDIQKEDVKISRQSTMHQIYKLFIVKYRDKIINDFEDMEESSELQLRQILEEIFELMEE